MGDLLNEEGIKVRNECNDLVDRAHGLLRDYLAQFISDSRLALLENEIGRIKLWIAMELKNQERFTANKLSEHPDLYD